MKRWRQVFVNLSPVFNNNVHLSSSLYWHKTGNVWKLVVFIVNHAVNCLLRVLECLCIYIIFNTHIVRLNGAVSGAKMAACKLTGNAAFLSLYLRVFRVCVCLFYYKCFLRVLFIFLYWQVKLICTNVAYCSCYWMILLSTGCYHNCNWILWN